MNNVYKEKLKFSSNLNENLFVSINVGFYK
jgi:hypothetical protein